MDFSLCGYDTELQPPDICPTLVQTACFTDSPTGELGSPLQAPSRTGALSLSPWVPGKSLALTPLSSLAPFLPGSTRL